MLQLPYGFPCNLYQVYHFYRNFCINATNVGPDQMPFYVVSDLGLQCFLRSLGITGLNLSSSITCQLKPRSHISCDCDAIALQPKNLKIAERSQRSQKGFIEVAKRSPIGRRTKLVTSCLFSMHKRLTTTNLVTHRFHWSPRGFKEVLC